MKPATATLLLLADGRLPSGGHAHSGGVEEAAADGRIRNATDLGRYLEGRLATTGRVDAALAATAAGIGVADPEPWAAIDAEAAARCPVPALRTAGRAQGRGLVRVARRLWPSPLLDTVAAGHAGGPLWPVAVGASAIAAGIDPDGAALVAAQAAITGPAWAAVRLLGLDPFAAAAELAALASSVDRLVADTVAATATSAALRALPAPCGPLTDVGAQAHTAREVRFFAS